MQSNNQLYPFLGAKTIISSLRDNDIDDLIYSCASDIDTIAKVLCIDPNYLSVQVRILLPFYSENDIKNAIKTSKIKIIRDVLVKLRYSLGDFENNYKLHRENNGIDTLPENLQVFDKADNIIAKNENTAFNLRFGLVKKDIGYSIQNNLHYIHKHREDTKFHFGIFLENYDYPICYCAISKCDREYQTKSLSLAIQDENINPNSVYVMTRAFGFTPLPHNMMSKLFDYSIKFIKNHHRSEKEDYPKYIITALNPFLGFNGGIFLGSSYTPYATSPMEYKYSENGLYLNRRNNDGVIMNQKYNTPPIVWLVRPLTNDARKKVDNIKYLYQVSEEEYKKG